MSENENLHPTVVELFARGKAVQKEQIGHMIVEYAKARARVEELDLSEITEVMWNVSLQILLKLGHRDEVEDMLKRALDDLPPSGSAA